jgi:hypothetical protein
MNECTVAAAIGDMRGGGKWGNPDVVGVYRPLAGEVMRFNPEIVTVEIKIEVGEAVTAFGQAVSYRLFSNKTYLFVPEVTAEDDKGRLESFCHLNGVGLVYFGLKKRDPKYVSRLRVQRFDPDMFYVNVFVRASTQVLAREISGTVWINLCYLA